jgi:monoamine oxidase
MGGPNAGRHSDLSDEEIFELGLETLSKAFAIEKRDIESKVVHWGVFNWQRDPYARGAYSYTTVDMGNAREQLAEPIEDTIFFAGEALYTGDETSTVEGALGSGKEVAKQILG